MERDASGVIGGGAFGAEANDAALHSDGRLKKNCAIAGELSKSCGRIRAVHEVSSGAVGLSTNCFHTVVPQGSAGGAPVGDCLMTPWAARGKTTYDWFGAA